MSSGKLISFEGIDGSGKSTQIKSLQLKFDTLGIKYQTFREPGGTPLSEKIRDILLDKENIAMSSISEGLLFAAARAQLVEEHIKPNLNNGKVVICDRFIDSTIAYQGYGRGLDVDILKNINEIATNGLVPDITFVLDIDPDSALKRIGSEDVDRMESVGIDFFRKIRKGYYEMIDKSPERFFLIDADQSSENVSFDINKIIKNIFI